MRTLVSLALALLATCSAAFADEKTAEKDKVDGPVTHVDAPAAAKLLAGKKKAGKPVILDIRTPAEFAEGHLKNAVNIDFRGEDFAEKLAKLDKAKPYVVHCRSGGRSSSSLDTFKKLGFKKIYHLDGGILGWEEAKLPVVK